MAILLSHVLYKRVPLVTAGRVGGIKVLGEDQGLSKSARGGILQNLCPSGGSLKGGTCSHALQTVGMSISVNFF